MGHTKGMSIVNMMVSVMVGMMVSIVAHRASHLRLEVVHLGGIVCILFFKFEDLACEVLERILAQRRVPTVSVDEEKAFHRGGV